MRFLAIAFIILALPLFCVWLKQGRRQRLWAYALIGLLPFTIPAWQLDAALINWEQWTGYAKGAVITLLDSLALAILFTHRAPKRLSPLLGWLFLYFFSAVLSIAMSDLPIASAFYAFQLVRVIILAMAVARIAPDSEGLRWIAFGLSAGVTFQAAITISQKAGGAIQAAGTMGHQNLLGMMTNFVLLTLLAMLLGGERSKLIMLGVISALVVIALGASRGTVGFAGLGLAIVFAMSFARGITAHKWRILGLSALALAMAAPTAYIMLEDRFAAQQTQSGAGEERRAFERAAQAMWRDHPMGVGANMYINVANSKGYSERAGVAWGWNSRSTNVHNAYLLIAAETGWVGLLSFIALFAAAIMTGLRFAFTRRRDPAGEIVLGWTAALIAVAAHNLYEWVLILYPTQYLLAIALGVIAGLARERRSAGSNGRKRSVPLISETLEPSR